MTKPVTDRKHVLPLLTRLLCAAALLLSAFVAQAGVVFTSLYSFQVFPNGETPEAGLVQGSDGNFYGTTSGGGTNGGNGTVFKISAAGALTTLHAFTGYDGANPQAALVQGSDGNFYGTTYGGGTNGTGGTVFKISANGALTTLYSFTGVNDGANPRAGLVQGSDGNFYGTTYWDNSGGGGTVFKISAAGALTTLYSFTGGYDGGHSAAGLVQGSDGNFYGTASGYGSGDYGTVFKISPAGALTTLYSFTGGNDGAYPFAGLVLGSDGNFYGTTAYGGYHGEEGPGTVFKISAAGALTTLYSFTNGTDGSSPQAALVQGNDGSFYSMTPGDYYGRNGDYGTVFKISPAGALTTLYSFTGGNDGASPFAGLVQGSDGNFYGTTAYGLALNDNGTVFKISASGALTTLYSFTGANDGGDSVAGLVQGSDGNFYGTTSGVFANDLAYGAPGTVFKISASGALTTLYSFSDADFGDDDGGTPEAGLVQSSDGNFYGTTCYGGNIYSDGTVFKISATGALTTLYCFSGYNGRLPKAGLVQGSDGDFYGTTSQGGKYYDYGDYGTVFKISATGALTTFYSFTGGNDGAYPQAGLVLGSDGNFYGTTSGGGTNGGNGTVFKISATGALTTLYSFTGGIDGASPWAGLVLGSDGNFYGTTRYGSHGNNGTVFKITAAGALTTLHAFTGHDGANPQAGLVLGSDGNFYGTTSEGGTNGANGTVFKISAAGALTTLHAFTGYNSAYPQAGLVQGSDGNFYGTTCFDGVGGAGTVFRLNIGLGVAQAPPQFQAVTLANGTLTLTWSTEAGGMYQLQYNSDLTSSNSTNLGSAVTATGATLSATDSVANGPQRFYRVVLLP